jgi:hypothetical protein
VIILTLVAVVCIAAVAVIWAVLRWDDRPNRDPFAAAGLTVTPVENYGDRCRCHPRSHTNRRAQPPYLRGHRTSPAGNASPGEPPSPGVAAMRRTPAGGFFPLVQWRRLKTSR